MEFDWSDDDELFRSNLKKFLDSELPEYHEIFHMPSAERWEFSKVFAAKLAERGWLTPAWPPEYGGAGQSAWQQQILGEELIAHGEPRAGQYMNVNWIGPAIIAAGTPEQKEHHLPRISKGDVKWCQGFSEPDAGSDLTALRTRAVRDGNEYVINGEKIWTSNAGGADFCFLLARTDPSARKGSGISVFLIPTDTPGFEIRDIPVFIHDGVFHHCVLTDVRVPESCRLGPENEGFAIVRRVLANERAGQPRYHRAAGYLDRLASWAQERGLLEDAKVVDQLATARAACETARILVYRVVDDRAHDETPELSAFVYRVAMILAERLVMEAAFEIQGSEGLVFRSLADSQLEWGLTAGIASGTYEINLNTIGRLLGFPKGW